MPRGPQASQSWSEQENAVLSPTEVDALPEDAVLVLAQAETQLRVLAERLNPIPWFGELPAPPAIRRARASLTPRPAAPTAELMRCRARHDERRTARRQRNRRPMMTIECIDDCRGDRRSTHEHDPWTRMFDRLTSIPTNWTKRERPPTWTQIAPIYRWQDAGAPAAG